MVNVPVNPPELPHDASVYVTTCGEHGDPDGAWDVPGDPP